MTLASDVDPCRLGKAREVDAAVLEEAPVFDSQHGINQYFGDVVVFHHLPLRTLIAIEERGNHFGLKLVGVELAAGISCDALDLSFAEPDRGGFRAVVRGWPGLYLKGIAAQVVTAHRRLAAFF